MQAVFDEVYGFIPPHPANPPTKRPLVTLMKQARGFGLGVVLAPRWFVLRNVHQVPPMALLQTRTTLSWLRGADDPIGREEGRD